VVEWTDIFIRCLINKVSPTTPIGTNDLTIEPKGKGAEPILKENAFSIMAPKIKKISPNSGKAKDIITITGSFFGTKKVKVYMEEGNGKNKKCKIIYLTMDPETGVSTVQIQVPKGLEPGPVDVTVTNKMVGSETISNGFIVQRSGR
jgi:hypothetical protein